MVLAYSDLQIPSVLCTEVNIYEKLHRENSIIFISDLQSNTRATSLRTTFNSRI
jgi:hypothetical protein